MTEGKQLVEGRWRIVETDMWDRDALDLVVPAHITFGRNGVGEMQLINMSTRSVGGLGSDLVGSAQCHP
jgi:hypothetical protein